MADTPDVLVIKLTKTEPRKNDPYDIPIMNYKASGLKYPSTARISKAVTLDESQILGKVGNLHPDDLRFILQKLIEFSEN